MLDNEGRTQDGGGLEKNPINNNNNPPGISKAGPGTGTGTGSGAGTKSWGATVSGQSVSNNSGGSAGTRSDPTKAMLVNENDRLSNLDVHGDDAGSQDAANGKKKKRGQRAVGADKNRGLRQFSMKVCEKVESKGTTTYNEVADELVAEFGDPISTVASPDKQQYDEKNIRRRVYDALNVLMAMDIISKDKKEIQWKGLPRTTLSDVEDLKAERAALKARVQKKAAYLQELEEQYIGLQNLIGRNEELYGSGDTPTGGVALPFILVQTRPHATVEVEISEDMQLVHFDFNSTPFELHDDNYVLKAMRFCDRPQSEDRADVSTPNAGEGSSMLGSMHPSCISHPLRLDNTGRTPMSPPLPGILKARVKHEH